MLIKCLTVGAVQANCYIVSDEESMESVVIDPGAESNTIMNYLEDNGLSCKYIFLTHGHFDHTGAADALRKQTGAPICINRKDVVKNPLEIAYKYKLPSGENIFIKEGDTMKVGSLVFEVLETPGHSQGSVTFRCEDVLFTGDTLFHGSIGRTDFPGCSYKDMMASLLKLCRLEGDYEVYPGHMDATTLEAERRYNFFIKEAYDSEK